eukprot:COSAG03_NODE_251_length_9941_cov_18.085145_12_plen_199_part_00
MRASGAQQPVSAAPGAPCVSVRPRARRDEPAAGWLCCAAWTWRQLSAKVGRGRRSDRLVWLVDGIGSAMGGRRACCWLLFRPAGNCRAARLKAHAVVVVHRGEVYVVDALTPGFPVYRRSSASGSESPSDRHNGSERGGSEHGDSERADSERSFASRSPGLPRVVELLGGRRFAPFRTAPHSIFSDGGQGHVSVSMRE